jgi:signal peptidase I
VVGLLVLAAVVLVPRAIEPMSVSSGSMAPTFNTGDELLVSKLSGSDPERGQVIVFHAPGSDLLVVKRVAALGGDVVAIRDGRLFVNGDRVHEDYLAHGTVDGSYVGPVDVPPRTVYVLGDNRADSVDSRDFGTLPVDRIVGVVLRRLWSGHESDLGAGFPIGTIASVALWGWAAPQQGLLAERHRTHDE